jgi:hypothetical protein
LKRLREFDAYAAAKIRPSESWQTLKYSGFREAFADGRHTEHLLWKALPQKSKVGIVRLLEDDPMGEKTKFAPLADEVSSSAAFARFADKFSAVGCPSLTRTTTSYNYNEPSDPASYEALVRFAFPRFGFPRRKTFQRHSAIAKIQQIWIAP